MLEQRCSECGFRLDPDNESQQVCPACGRDPIRWEAVEYDSEITAALAVRAILGDQPPLPQSMEEALPVDSDVDYLSDPELDQIMAQAEADIRARFEGPILVAGNQLIN